MRLENLLVLFVATLLFGSCNKDKDKDTIVNIEDEFVISMFESLGESPDFQLLIETAEDQPCKDAQIATSAFSQPGSLTANIHEVDSPSDCTSGAGPATGLASFGFLASGKYEIIINLKDVVENIGELTVRQDRFDLAMENKDGISLQENTLFRIPKNFIWGYIAYDDASEVGQAPANLLADLAAATGPTFLPTGHFGYFNLKDGVLSLTRDLPGHQHLKTFFFQTDGDTSPIENLVSDYRAGGTGDAMEIRVFTWDGVVF